MRIFGYEVQVQDLEILDGLLFGGSLVRSFAGLRTRLSLELFFEGCF